MLLYDWLRTPDICLVNWSMKGKRLVPAEETSRTGQQSEQLSSVRDVSYIWIQ